MVEREGALAKEAQLPVIGGRYRHFEGTEYIVDRVVFNATGYEKTGNLRGKVFYTQVIAGDFPEGTEYERELEDFFGRTMHDGKETNIFELIPKETDSSEKEYLNQREAASYLSVHPKTLYRYVRTGMLSSFRLGGVGRPRYLKTDLDKLFRPTK